VDSAFADSLWHSGDRWRPSGRIQLGQAASLI